MPLVQTRAAALAAGLTPSQVDGHLRAGRWLVLRRGVYLTAPALPDQPDVRHALLVQAAVLACGVPAVGSHASAALVHGLPLLRPHPGPPLLTRLRSPGRPRSAALRGALLTSVVPPHHRVRLHGAPVTSLVRTAADLARTRDDLDAVVALDAVLARVPRERVLRVLDEQHGWPGSAAARRRVGMADGRSESPLESLGRVRMVQGGLPTPQLQVVVGGGEGPIGRVDYLWSEQRTVAEADGREKYERPSALWAEKRREDALRDAGFEVVRFTWDEASRRPQLLVDRVRRAFARASARSRAA